MADTTTNLGLVKPYDNETADIQVINTNMDKIDAAVIAKLLEAKGYTDDKIAQLINSAPQTMDTLKELADALGDDPNFRTSMLNMISSKANSSDLGELQGEVDSHKADYVRQPGYAITSGTNTAYTITLNPSPTAYADGMGIVITPHIDCGDSPTLNVNNLGIIPLLRSDGTAFVAGDLKAGIPRAFRRVGNNFFSLSSKYDVNSILTVDKIKFTDMSVIESSVASGSNVISYSYLGENDNYIYFGTSKGSGWNIVRYDKTTFTENPFTIQGASLPDMLGNVSMWGMGEYYSSKIAITSAPGTTNGKFIYYKSDGASYPIGVCNEDGSVAYWTGASMAYSFFILVDGDDFYMLYSGPRSGTTNHTYLSRYNKNNLVWTIQIADVNNYTGKIYKYDTNTIIIMPPYGTTALLLDINTGTQVGTKTIAGPITVGGRLNNIYYNNIFASTYDLQFNPISTITLVNGADGNYCILQKDFVYHNPYLYSHVGDILYKFDATIIPTIGKVPKYIFPINNKWCCIFEVASNSTGAARTYRATIIPPQYKVLK